MNDHLRKKIFIQPTNRILSRYTMLQDKSTNEPVLSVARPEESKRSKPVLESHHIKLVLSV